MYNFLDEQKFDETLAKDVEKRSLNFNKLKKQHVILKKCFFVENFFLLLLLYHFIGKIKFFTF